MHEKVFQNLLTSHLQGSAEKVIHGEVPGLVTHCEATWGVPWKLSVGKCYSLELATEFQSFGTRCQGKPTPGRSHTSGTCWDTALRTLWDAAHKDMTGSARSRSDLKEKLLPPAVSLWSPLWTKFNTMLPGKGEILSPAPVLHSRQWRVDLELSGNTLIDSWHTAFDNLLNNVPWSKVKINLSQVIAEKSTAYLKTQNVSSSWRVRIMILCFLTIWHLSEIVLSFLKCAYLCWSSFPFCFPCSWFFVLNYILPLLYNMHIWRNFQ